MSNASLIPASGLAAIAVLFGVALSGTALSAAASEYRCERADQTVRRVELVVEDAATGVPCEVVYWKDHEEPGVRRVLWNAQTDAGFCERKAKELVATLEEGGWECATPSPATRQAATPPPGPGDAPPQAGSQAAGTAGSSPPLASAQPEPAARPAAGQKASGQTVPEQKAGEQKESSIRAALAPPPAPESAGPSVPGHPADDGPQTSARPQSTALDSIIEQNLVRLNDGVEGQFAAKVGRYGDLDGDGLDDGLVFFTYQSERLGEARFIAAYLYDGETYSLAATKPVAGSDDRVQSAEVEGIEGGVISLRLNVLEPGDATCCPSGSRHQSLVLQDGQLVEVNSSTGPRTDSPS